METTILSTTSAERRSPARSILASAVAHTVVLTVVVVLAPVVVEHSPHLVRTSLVFSPMPPAVSMPEPARPEQIYKPLVLPEAALEPSPLPPPPVDIEPELKQTAKAPTPIPEIVTPAPAPPTPAPAPPAKPAVKTGLFAAAPNPAPAPDPTQGPPLRTGGFDSQEVAAEPSPHRNAARVGGFNTLEHGDRLARVAYRTTPPSTGGFAVPGQLPAASNGSGSRPVVTGTAFGSPVSAAASPSEASRDTPAAAGFGGPAVSDRQPRSQPAPVSRAGFGDVEARPATPEETRPQEAAARQTPLEILGKPRPVYTADGRRLKIEGEVVLRVLFRASGEVRVLDVVEGLGFGLDESARQAAEAIRFVPATRDGVPVDATATVRIQFQLAY